MQSHVNRNIEHKVNSEQRNRLKLLSKPPENERPDNRKPSNTPNPQRLLCWRRLYVTGNFKGNTGKKKKKKNYVLRHVAKYNYKYQNSSTHLAAQHAKKK